MRRVHALSFEALEGRKLLSRTHVAAAHPAPPVKTPIVLNGTLNVDDKGASTITNPDGSSTMYIPVAGQLGSIGEVHGYWEQNLDSFGDKSGADTVSLHASNGDIMIAFNNLSPGKGHAGPNKTVYYQHNQRFVEGTGAYGHATESGTIQIYNNASASVIESMTIHTTSS